MAVQEPILAGLVNQMLASEHPRCFWSPLAFVGNAAFRAAHGNGELLATARSVFAGEPPPVVETGAFSWAFTRIVHAHLAGVYICGIPTGIRRDERLTNLPSILQFHSGRLPNHANLHRLMELVTASDPSLFVDALLFVSEDGKPFVLVHNTRTSKHGLRSWSRWPLERLFVKRRSAIITNPRTREKGLAIPFLTVPGERYVVVFPLRAGGVSDVDRDFLSVVGCVAAVVPTSGLQRGVNAYDRIESAAVPLTPRLFYCGSPTLQTRISALLDGHGWDLTTTERYQELLSIAGSPFDVMLIDEGALPDTLTMLRWLRHAAPGTPILFFGERQDEEAEILVDDRISPSSSDDAIFLAIKNVVRQLPQRRRDFLEAVVHRLAPALSSTVSYAQLARSLARALIDYFGDWAAVHLVDSEGDLFHAELPARNDPLMPSVPLTFINGYAVMKSRVDDGFLSEICQNEEEREALASLRPRSGAALPLANGGKVVGSIFVLSTRRDLDEPDFEALSHFADLAARAFVTLQARIQRKRAGLDNWSRVSTGRYDIDSFAPLIANRKLFGVIASSGDAISIQAKNAQGGTLSATLDVEDNTLSFESSRFPAPLYVAASGPAGLVETGVPEHAASKISLKELSVTLIYDSLLMEEADPASVVDVLQRGLRDGERNPAALLAALGGERVPFIAITFR